MAMHVIVFIAVSMVTLLIAGLLHYLGGIGTLIVLGIVSVVMLALINPRA